MDLSCFDWGYVTHFFMMMYRRALPSVWSSYMISNEAAELLSPGSCTH